MMTFKRVHWLYSYVVVFLVFFIILFVDVKQKVALLLQKQVAEKKALDAIEVNKDILSNTVFSQKKASLKIDNKLLETSDLLVYITHYFVSQGMTVNKVQLFKIKTFSGVNALPVKVNAVGNFAALVKLIAALSVNSRPIVINDFSLHFDRNGVMMIETQLLVFAVNAKALSGDFHGHQPDIMCALMNTVSLKQIKWVGFLRGKKTMLGLIMLPTGETIEVQVGSIIGVEKGKVVSVGEEGMMIDVRGEKKYVGTYNSRPAYLDQHKT